MRAAESVTPVAGPHAGLIPADFMPAGAHFAPRDQSGWAGPVERDRLLVEVRPPGRRRAWRRKIPRTTPNRIGRHLKILILIDGRGETLTPTLLYDSGSTTMCPIRVLNPLSAVGSGAPKGLFGPGVPGRRLQPARDADRRGLKDDARCDEG